MGRRAATWEFESRFPLFTRLALISAWLLGVLGAYQAVRQGLVDGNLGRDAHAYWLAAQGTLSYERPPGAVDAYLYSPAFAIAIRPLTWLPWPAFLATWMVVASAAAVWLLARVRLRWAVPLFLLCVPEIVVGNVFLLIAVCLAAGLRAPALWAFPLLTKVTTAVGLLWFPFRRQWRPVLLAAITTVIVVVLSAVLLPGAWLDWLAFLWTNSGGTRDGSLGFAARLLMALVLLWWGARTGRTWTIAASVVLAAPISNPMTFTMLIAIPRLAEQRMAPLRRATDPREETFTH